jgi:hypothetical protein
MARTVTFYKVTHLLGEDREETFFPTKAGANAFVIEAMRRFPTSDCRIDPKTIDLDKDGVASLLNETVRDCKKQAAADKKLEKV